MRTHPYDLGKKAFLSGKKMKCPHKAGTKSATAWKLGYTHAAKSSEKSYKSGGTHAYGDAYRKIPQTASFRQVSRLVNQINKRESDIEAYKKWLLSDGEENNQ